MVAHTVQEGECLHTIAAQYGFFWETLWKDSANQDLRNAREGPDGLLPGDVVQVPDVRRREEKCPTDHAYIFRKKAAPCIGLQTEIEFEELPLVETELEIEEDSLLLLEMDLKFEEDPLPLLETDLEFEEPPFLETESVISEESPSL